MTSEQDLLLDCWAQFAISVYEDADQEWFSDGALSTLEHVAEYLCKQGLLVKHPTMDWYRFAEIKP